MTAAQIVGYLAERGYRVGLSDDGSRLVVEPSFTDDALRERVRARRSDVIAFLQELGAPAATAHAFVVPEDGDVDSIRDYGVCIACGIPWVTHGRPTIEAWSRVADVDSVALIDARAIALAAAAESLT